jgi:hypothetical protein
MKLPLTVLVAAVLALPAAAHAQGNPFGPVTPNAPPVQQPAAPPQPTAPQKTRAQQDTGLDPKLLVLLIAIGVAMVGATLFAIIRGSGHDLETLHPERERRHRRRVSKATGTGPGEGAPPPSPRKRQRERERQRQREKAKRRKR